ncbi:MAG TPA: hypothetical protein VF782_09640 [Allosphingosinicella sp.]|jgi:hypothetical protein
MSVQQVLPLRRLWTLAVVTLLGAPLSPALAKEPVHLYFHSKGQEPQRFYYFLYSVCHKRENWRGDQQGCIAWLKARKGIHIRELPLGTKDAKANTHFYAVPVCGGALVWHNNAVGIATPNPQRKNHQPVELKCLRP